MASKQRVQEHTPHISMQVNKMVAAAHGVLPLQQMTPCPAEVWLGLQLLQGSASAVHTAAVQDFGLHNYASKFASNGMAVFVFDYRGWGGSSGSPRHWLSAKRHMADWRAAIQHVRNNMTDSVDTSKLCLWGTSFAGGHALIVASEPEFAPHISAIVAQVPNLDAAVSTKTSLKQRGIVKSLRMLAAGLVDLLRTSLGQEPLYLPLAGLHGGMGFMQMTPSEFERYKSNKPKTPQVGCKPHSQSCSKTCGNDKRYVRVTFGAYCCSIWGLSAAYQPRLLLKLTYDWQFVWAIGSRLRLVDRSVALLLTDCRFNNIPLSMCRFCECAAHRVHVHCGLLALIVAWPLHLSHPPPALPSFCMC
eukprot:GHUV01019805.1.p1 GENE.GHUV01019805.1~~GHUV01019805.1.p1  ORF type:complete len:360 (+),score=60.97 GHUV01019805.1:566-1645(+)